MAFKDLQDFISFLENKKELKRVKTEVDSNLEITEIVDRVSKNYGPAILFENVKNSNYPVLINAFGSYERMAMALGVDKLDDIADDILDLMDVSSYVSLMNKIKSIPKLTRMLKVFPKKVSNGACQEVIEDADLDTLPVLKCWPEDGGPFMTLPLVITKDPETGMQNIGIYTKMVNQYMKNIRKWGKECQ
jgi:4-hydroxy-3-polyprenylbenzoate decarboxylase